MRQRDQRDGLAEQRGKPTSRCRDHRLPHARTGRGQQRRPAPACQPAAAASVAGRDRADLTNPLVLRSILDTQVHGLLLKDSPLSELVTVVCRIQRGFHYIGKSALEVLSQADPGNPAAPGQAGAERLSRREMEVLRLYLTGRSVSEIAVLLCRSVKTISRQKNCAMQKLGVTNDRELFEFAALNGMLLTA
ncbi:response regulator NarL family [Cupriavidus necator N-1]|uniref:Response regulator NarL family n=1 Tax=Cupriavidus necator (strain ATCC 43291 / DSM 13513 / CCUG 52238 / LMG 8453 / N-1) TaxID=1042878 RepID=F8GS47_CUPNN|nr:response regulator NarL family [Cupriavidus necator N-1]